MTTTISTLHAMAGRFLANCEPLAWEADSMRRCVDLVRAFQVKAIDPAGLQAALTSDRSASATPPKRGPGVALLELTGVLMPTASIFSLLGFGTSLRTFMTLLTAASVDASVKSIVVVVDSPGGSIRLTTEAAQLLRTVRARKPVVAAVVGLDASAAYWITSGATAIAATSSAMVGAIGVITQRESITKLLEKAGIEIAVIAAGKHKGEGHLATPISDAERTWLQAQVDAAYRDFVAGVALGRHVSPATVREGYGEGRLVRAEDALRLGMIDRVELLDQTIERTIAAPATLTAMLTRRVERQLEQQYARHSEQGRGEIAEYRRRAALRQTTRV